MKKKDIIKILKELDINLNDTSYMIHKKIFDSNIEGIFHTSGMTKHCIVFSNYNYVIKWSKKHFIKEEFKEAELYKLSKEFKIDKAFTETYYFCKYNDINFFLQRKIDYIASNLDFNNKGLYNHIKETTKNIKDEYALDIQESIYNRIDLDWVKMLIFKLGDTINTLIDFIDMYNINDLHSGNIAFIGDNPVIFDFQGYYLED